MSTSAVMPARRALLTSVAIVLAWIPAATVAAPRDVPLLDPVVVSAEAAPADSDPGDAAEAVAHGA